MSGVAAPGGAVRGGWRTACGPLRTFACVRFVRSTVCGDRVRRCPASSPTVAALAALGVAFEGTPPLLPAKGCPVSARHAWEAPRSAGFLARERSEPREHFWRILFERSERSERSELCAGPGTRAPQGSLSAAKAASVACRALTGQPFAATISRVQTNVRNGPQPDASIISMPTRQPARRRQHHHGHLGQAEGGEGLVAALQVHRHDCQQAHQRTAGQDGDAHQP